MCKGIKPATTKGEYMSTMTLLLDERNCVLVTEDWYFNVVYKGDVPIFDAEEIISIG